MAEWRAGWWARTFGGASRWLLVIEDGRLQVHVESQRIETGVLDVIEIRAEPGKKLLTIRIANQPSVTLTGAARRVARQATAVLSEQVADQRRLTDLTERAIAQGDEARRWWSEANAAMTRRRWIDRETVASIDRGRPDVSASVAAYSDPRLADFVAGRPENERTAIDACRTVDLTAWATRQNKSFIEWEKSESGGFFRTVEKSPLTDEQILATICFDNRVRAIASAGSGKTSTMVARAGYAVRRGIAEPGEILMLAFNKKAAAELSERTASRLGDQGAAITATTFHAFGLRVIGEATDRKPGLPDDLANESGIGRLSRIVDALRDQDPGFRRDWDLFRLVFGRHLPEFGHEPAPEAADRRTGAQGFKTLAGEVMKSQEEVMIANWLFFNGVQYQYERPYEHDVADASHRQYQPDFFYPAIDVYHEHWALGPDGNPPPHFAGYADSMNWRLQTHARFGTRLIQTTSANIRDGSGFTHLAKELTQLGVELDENPYREAAGEPPISDRALVQLMRTFMVHAKGNRLTADELARRAGTVQWRSRVFLRLLNTVSGAWDRELRANHQIDFEDMLNLATDHIESGRWASPYRVVMVDEMQDASTARAALVRALLKRPGSYLYAVGDDWQSINRFAGADLGVLTRFSEWFGDAETVWLSQTFRSPQSLCDVAGSFVMENPAQLKKRVRSSAPEPGESLTAIGLKDHSEYDNAVWGYCTRLDEELDSPATVLILSRYRQGRNDVPSALNARFSQLTVEFNTIHASKGKEADYVVVLGLEARGFPSTVEDDPLLQLAMAAPDSFSHAEERRLFYVALTRARRSVLLLTRTGHESPFLIELIRANAVQVRSPTGINITPAICPKCKKRIMRRRRGKRGPFLGCDGYPLCTGTMDISQQRSLSQPMPLRHCSARDHPTGARARQAWRIIDAMATENTARLAVLIDADNAQSSITEGLLAEVAKYGTAHVKRAYGDWTATNLRGWKDQLLAQSIQPIQQFAYTTGKNATDAAMVIDAMDLLYSGRFDGFCIVSSDSDFTRLAARLRESGMTVYGFGERKTPKPFVAACDKFIYVENLRFTEEVQEAGSGDAAKPARRKPATATQLKNDAALVSLLRNAVEAASDDDGWAPLAAVGNILTNQRPDFDSRSYGYGKLSDLIKATTLFEVERHSPGDGKQALMYAREKPLRKSAR